MECQATNVSLLLESKRTSKRAEKYPNSSIVPAAKGSVRKLNRDSSAEFPQTLDDSLQNKLKVVVIQSGRIAFPCKIKAQSILRNVATKFSNNAHVCQIYLCLKQQISVFGTLPHVLKNVATKCDGFLSHCVIN